MTSQTTIRKAVIPVAGLGTRMLPATKAVPKELLPVLTKPVLQYAVEEALGAGIEEIILVTSLGKEAIARHFQFDAALDAQLRAKGKDALASRCSDFLPGEGRVQYVYQDKPRGLGHAIGCAARLVEGEPFAVLLPDVLVPSSALLQAMVGQYRKQSGHVLGLAEVEAGETDKYGIVALDGWKVTGMVEKPKPADAPSRWSILGRYILHPAIIPYLLKQGEGAGGEIQLTDAILASLRETGCHGTPIEGPYFDCGNPAGYLQAILHAARQDPELATLL